MTKKLMASKTGLTLETRMKERKQKSG